MLWLWGRMIYHQGGVSLLEEYVYFKALDADAKMVIPVLIDCPTHLAYGGWRPEEFAMRVKGESYLDIAKSGGGILSTVKATREAGEDDHYDKALSFKRDGRAG